MDEMNSDFYVFFSLMILSVIPDFDFPVHFWISKGDLTKLKQWIKRMLYPIVIMLYMKPGYESDCRHQISSMTKIVIFNRHFAHCIATYLWLSDDMECEGCWELARECNCFSEFLQMWKRRPSIFL